MARWGRPDMADRVLYEVPPEAWPKVERQGVALHEKELMSGIV